MLSRYDTTGFARSCQAAAQVSVGKRPREFIFKKAGKSDFYFKSLSFQILSMDIVIIITIIVIIVKKEMKL